MKQRDEKKSLASFDGREARLFLAVALIGRHVIAERCDLARACFKRSRRERAA